MSGSTTSRCPWFAPGLVTLAMTLGVCAGVVRDSRAQPPPPPLTAPVNDFANVIDGQSKVAMDRAIRDLLAATGDTLIVATVQTVAPFADAKELAVKMFENRGAGIGKKDKDNGLLVLLAVKERQVWVEVGYGLEEIVTDGYAGDVSRQIMTPSFKRGEYGQGLRAGVEYFALHIADARGVSVDGVRRPATAPQRPTTRSTGLPSIGIIILMLLFAGAKLLGWFIFPSSLRRSNRWGGGWSGWGGGGFGGGGFGGGGFGGFGGGGSGGGGGGASW
jgi:uncharacterized protein